MDHAAYFRAYNQYCDLILKRPDSVVRVAVISDDKDVALGFSVIERDTLHYVFVQGDQRNKGIARALVPVPINVISHINDFMIDRSLRHARLKYQFSRLIFNPFA